MLLRWFDARKATEVGAALADRFATTAKPDSGRNGKSASGDRSQNDSLREFMTRAEKEINQLDLNFYKKAKLANSFKWRLVEKGVNSEFAAEITQTLVMNLSMGASLHNNSCQSDGSVRSNKPGAS